MTKERKTYLAGFFTLLALILLGVGILVSGRKGGLFTPTYTLVAEFPKVYGLKPGSEVQLQGVQVGYVKGVYLASLPEKTVRVHLAIEKRVQEWIRRDSFATITTKGLLGDQIVEIQIGSPDQPVLPPSSTIPTVPPYDFGTIVQKTGETISAIGDFTRALRDLAEILSRGEGSLGKIVRDDALYYDLRKTIQRLSFLMKVVTEGEGVVGSLLTDRDLKEDLKGVVKNLRGKKGTVPLLLNDPSLYENLVSAVTELKAVLSLLQAPEGTVGSLMKEREVYEQLKETLKEVELLVKDIRENPSRYFKIRVF